MAPNHGMAPEPVKEHPNRELIADSETAILRIINVPLARLGLLPQHARVEKPSGRELASSLVHFKLIFEVALLCKRLNHARRRLAAPNTMSRLTLIKH